MTDADEKDLKEMRTMLAGVELADSDIRSRMYDRCVLYSKAIGLSKELTERFGFAMEDMEKISMEFERRGFASKKARDAAMKMRALFFDDSRDDFRDVRCVRISAGGGSDYRIQYDELTFEFQHAPTGKCFELDCKVYNPRSRFFDTEGVYLASRGECLSGFALVHPYSEHCSGTVAYGYDPTEFRKNVIEYADRGFAPEKKEDREEDRWEYYDDFNYGRLQQEEYDYIRRLERT